jgi:MFS family permease
MADTMQRESGESHEVFREGGRSSVIVLILLCLTYAFDYTDRMIVASLLPFIKQDWGLSDQLLGSLSGVVSLFIALFVLPLSLIVDRWSRRKMVALMVFFWSVATIACAFARNYEELLLARAFTGIGEAGYAPAAIAIIAASFPRERRAIAVGIWDAFAPIGAGLGFLIGGYVGMHYGWQHAFGLVGIPGIILAVLYWFTRDYRTVPLETVAAASKSTSAALWLSIRQLFEIPTLWFVYIAFAMNIAVTTPIMTWFPSYLNRFHGMDQQRAGSITAILAMLLLVGAPLGGYLSDRWMEKRANARMVFSGITSLASALLLGAAFLAPHSMTFIPFMVGFGVLSVAFLAPAAAVIQDVVHPGMRALAYGLCVVCQHILGASWSPMFIGGISDHIGLEKALLITPSFGIIACVMFLIGARYYERDMARVKNVILFNE